MRSYHSYSQLSCLTILYSYYGSYKSWVGIGTGTVPDPYNFTESKLPILGYSNSTIRLFSASSFYSGELGNKGTNASATQNLISKEFLKTGDLIPLSSGNPGSSTPVGVYSKRTLAMRFLVEFNEPSISIKWFGNEAPGAGQLNTTIYGYDGAAPNSSIPISSRMDNSDQFTNTVGWQTPLQYNADFTPGYYWIVFSCQSCNQSDGYDIYVRNQYLSGQDAQVFGQQNSNGAWSSTGSSILWMKDAAGYNLAVYPYVNGFVGGISAQSFLATSSFSFNTVFFDLNQQPQNAAIGVLKIMDLTEGETLATANLSQSKINGMQGWVPFQLSSIVNTTQGNEYQIDISETDASRIWGNSFGGINSDPGFQNQTRYLLFRLALINMSQSNLDYTSVGQTTTDSLTAGHLDAVGFSPSVNETLVSVGILMRSQSSKGGNYTSGMADVSIRMSVRIGLNEAHNPFRTRTYLSHL